MSRTKGTESTWPDETPDEVIERARRDHGDTAAEQVRRAIFGDLAPARKKRPPRRAGAKPLPTHGIPATSGHGQDWKALGDLAKMEGSPGWWEKSEAKNERRKRAKVEEARLRREAKR